MQANNMTAGTTGGTLLSVLPIIATEEFLKTIFLAIVGAIVSFMVSLLIKVILKKYK
jgi:hypothetical protein